MIKNLLSKQLKYLKPAEKAKLSKIISEMFSDEYRKIKKPHDNSKPKPNCPTCDSDQISKNGFFGGVQKYKCKDCNRAYLAAPPEEVVYVRELKPIKLLLPYFIEGHSMKKCANLTGVEKSTAKLWQRRILENLEKKYQKAI